MACFYFSSSSLELTATLSHLKQFSSAGWPRGNLSSFKDERKKAWWADEKSWWILLSEPSASGADVEKSVWSLVVWDQKPISLLDHLPHFFQWFTFSSQSGFPAEIMPPLAPLLLTFDTGRWVEDKMLLSGIDVARVTCLLFWQVKVTASITIYFFCFYCHTRKSDKWPVPFLTPWINSNQGALCMNIW